MMSGTNKEMTPKRRMTRILIVLTTAIVFPNLSFCFKKTVMGLPIKEVMAATAINTINELNR